MREKERVEKAIYFEFLRRDAKRGKPLAALLPLVDGIEEQRKKNKPRDGKH